MSELLLVGGGGHCHACIDVIEAEGEYTIKGIVQPVEQGSSLVLDYQTLGSDCDLADLIQRGEKAFVTVGQVRSPHSRIRLFNYLRELDVDIPIICSPISYCSQYAHIELGTIVMHGAIVNACASIGVNCIINSKALIEHDSKIGDHCHISTGALINGGVQIGRGSFVGSGAVIREGVSIGRNVVIGAGQVVLQDVADGVTIKNVKA